MADKMKDAEDRKLEALFASDPVPDRGFSVRVEKRIRRQLWIRRLTLPIAVLIGGLFAAKPLAGLLTGLFGLLSVFPADVASSIGGATAIDLPQFSTLMFGGMVALALVMVSRILED